MGCFVACLASFPRGGVCQKKFDIAIIIRHRIYVLVYLVREAFPEAEEKVMAADAPCLRISPGLPFGSLFRDRRPCFSNLLVNRLPQSASSHGQ
jgi:hypothetical protein